MIFDINVYNSIQSNDPATQTKRVKTKYEYAFEKTLQPDIMLIVASNMLTMYLIDKYDSKNNKYFIMGLNTFLNLYLTNLIQLH